MIEQLPINHKKAKKQHSAEHVTMTPYVVGFVLSLVFTLIPYYLVVTKSLTARTILAAIIAFAVLQMTIQLFFFLHLGREKKPHFNSFFLMSTLGIIVFVVVGSIWIMAHLSHNMSAMNVTDKIITDEAVYQINGTQAGTCPAGTGTNYKVMVMDNIVTPSHVDAHLCDTLTIMNHDEVTREITFGEHFHHSKYAGETSENVRPGRSMVVRLTELGTYKFHDHMMDQVSGDFTVTK